MNQAPSTHIESKQTKNLSPAERRDIVKNEYLDGRIVPKSAANRWHNIISTNLIVAIGSRVQRANCELYGGDMPVRIGRNSVCFPDLVVVNGEPEFANDSAELLLNPTVLIEVFPGNAKSSDRMQKLEGFLAVPKIKECLLVNQTEVRIEHYARQNAKQWIYRIYDERDDGISIDSIGCKLTLGEVYAHVKIAESELSSKAVN